MANPYSSPGVYITEIDKSWYETPKTRSVSVTILGPAKRGPMNVPTDVETVNEFQDIFGTPFENGGLCACLCLNVASSVKFVRIAGSTASAREVKIAGSKLSDVPSAVVFTNAVAGTIDEDTWTMQVSEVDDNPRAVNFKFMRGSNTVYDSTDETLTDEDPKGPFDPSEATFKTVTLPAIANKCGFETPTAGTFTQLKPDVYEFSAGTEDTKRSVTVPGKTPVPVADVLTLTYNEMGTIDDEVWEAEIANSEADTFDLIIRKGDSVFYTSEDGTSHGTLTFREGPDVPNSVANQNIEGFDIVLDMGDATDIPDSVTPFTQGDNGWDNMTGEQDPGTLEGDPIIEGLDTVSDREVVSTEIIAVPDVHSKTYLKHLADIADNRRDILMLLDLPRDISEEDAVSHLEDLNTSYSASYYPWVEVYNSFDNVNQTVPPSVAMLPAMMEEYLTYPRWTAPAGEPRLDLKTLISYAKVLNQASRDILYQGCINPLCNYRNLGNTAMGQRTLLRDDEKGRFSSLNRINVRLLLNYIKVNLELISASYIFSNIDQVTMDSWVLEVTKFLDSIKNQRGLYDYRVAMNWSTVTPENLNNNIMPGVVQVKPTKVAEFIPIDVVILNRDDEFAQ